MFPFPSPRSSKDTLNAPVLVTDELTLKNFAATACAGAANSRADTAMRAMRIGRRMVWRRMVTSEQGWGCEA